MKSILGLAAWCALCLAVGVSGSAVTAQAIAEWYPGLAKPSWTPPNWIFAPVWTFLYILMGTAAWRVWKPAGFSAAKIPLGLFLLQLALNAAWSWLFFGMRNPLAGLIDIGLLWLAILATGLSFKPVDPWAAWLLLPYGLWVSYASALNLAIFWMNRSQ